MKKADEILKGLLSNYNLELGQTYSAFFSSWTEIAGTDLAAHSRVKDIEGQTLIVEVDHPGWMQLVQMNRDSLLSKTGRMFPQLEIREIRIQLK